MLFPARTCQPGVKPPLLQAVECGDYKRVENLLTEGANPNHGQPPFSRVLPLDAALKRGDEKLATLLREHGALTRAEWKQTARNGSFKETRGPAPFDSTSTPK